jgi:pimeloyl-ACP methyl ester carboxylesterase
LIAEQNSQELWHTVTQDLPVFFQEQHQIVESGLPGPTDPSILENISVPVLLLHETDSKLWFMDSPKYIAEHVKVVYYHQPIQDTAHCAPCAHSVGHAVSLEGCLNAKKIKTWLDRALTG